MYLVIIGTTDYIEDLRTFLVTSMVSHTLLEGTSSWRGLQLNAQVVITFTEEDALKVQKFMIEKCGQKSVPVAKIAAEFI